MFAAASQLFTDAVGTDSLFSIGTIEDADNCKLLNIVIKKKNIIKKPEYRATNFSLQEILKKRKKELSVEPETHELVEYVRSSKVSLKGKLGIGIMKEIASVSASEKESLELKSDFGLVNKNEVPIESLCSALEGRRINMKNDLVQKVSKTSRTCLCLIMVTTTLADSDAVVSAQEDIELAVDAEVKIQTPAPVQDVTLNAGVGRGQQVYDKLTLIKGLALAYSVLELEIQKNGAVKVVRLKGEEGGFVPTKKEEDVSDEDDDDVKDDADNDGKATDDGVMSFLQEEVSSGVSSATMVPITEESSDEAGECKDGVN